MSFFDSILKALKGGNAGGDTKAQIVTTEQLNLLKQSFESLEKVRDRKSVV